MDPLPSRRRVLATVAGAASVGLAGCSGDQSTDRTTDPGRRTETTGAPGDVATATVPEAVDLETLADGLEAPLDVSFAPDADRRYVADQTGRVHVHGPDGLGEEPFLDLRETVVVGRETGLLGIALHPGFAENRRVFVRYSAPRRSGTPEGYSHTFVLAEFEASADGRRVDRDSERSVLEIPEPQANHNSGSLAFGPDGHLYVGVGDGGGGGDRGTGHVEDWYGANAGGNGQDVTENLLGSILRIDVDGRDGDSPYAIPEDNPLVGTEGLDEHFAWGFRNPWGMAFDEGDLYVADVGQSNYEEVNRVRKGGNYGWNVKEGTHCYGTDDCPDETPEDVRSGEPFRNPVVEYPHSDAAVSGVSVIGGRIYRGSELPSLSGAYVFGDLNAEGQLFVATPADEGQWPTAVLELAGEDAGKLDRILSFGRDDSGAVYVLGTGDDGGGLYRIVPAD